MKQSRKFAVTGGIGSGKSYVLELIRKRGYPVFSCDEISRGLWREKQYRRELALLFPQCTREGEVDKAALTSLVFSDADALARLDRFSHPRIMEELFARMEREPVAFAEVPLLFEGGYETCFEGVIAVVREEGERIEAVMQRDGLSEEEIRLRMSRQFDPSKLAQKQCDILVNDSHLTERLDRLLKQYRL